LKRYYTIMNDIITEALLKNGYIILEDALSQTLTNNLLTLAKQEKEYKNAAISKSSAVHINKNRRSDKTKWIDPTNATLQEYLDTMEKLQIHLNRSLFLGLSYYEAHFALYEQGDFYEKHLDSFIGAKNRVVTTVYYLNEAWECQDGGELVIYDKNEKELQRVLPKANTLVVFMSEEFPHEVLPANKQRFSIAGWFRVDTKLF